MGDRTFLDTGVLAYCYAGDHPGKREVVRGILREGALHGDLCISTQVLQELFSVVRTKFRRTISAGRAEESLRRLLDFEVVTVDPDLVLAAAARSREESADFWDALIIEAALRSGCTRLLSEDFQHGRAIGSLRVENPFAGGKR